MNSGSPCFDVIGLGFACVDTLCVVPRYPEEGGKIRVETRALEAGGQTLTALCALSRLGRSTAVAACIGDDPQGRYIQRVLQAEGIHPLALVRRPGVPTATATLVVGGDRGERTVLWHREPGMMLRPEDMPPEGIGACRALLVDGHETAAAVQAARQAKASGALVMLDGELLPLSRGAPSVGWELLALVDVAIVSEAFGPECLGISDPLEVCRELSRAGPEVVVVTLGEQGAQGLDARPGGHGTFRLAAHPMPVVDTTGAGDIYHAGFLHGLLEGWPVERCAAFAGAFATLSVRHLGGRPGIPTEAEALELLGEG